MSMSQSWQLDLPGVSVTPARTVQERSVLANKLYASASNHFERYAASFNAGEPDYEAARRWTEERERADKVMNGKA